jgi:hypothetical protein
MDGWNGLSKATIELYNSFCAEAHTQINCLRLKKNKTLITKAVYEKYIDFMLDLESGVHSFRKLQADQSALK